MPSMRPGTSKSQAAVLREPKGKLPVEEIEVAPPKHGEAMGKARSGGLCGQHSNLFKV